MKKRMLSLLLAMTMAAAATAGCGLVGGPEAEKDAGEQSAAPKGEKEVYKIGICQQMEHQALDSATEGFRDALTEKLGADHVEFDYQNAQGEQTNCSSIATKFVNSDVDLILGNATTALQTCAAATADIPIVGTCVTDYVTAGVVESNEAPGRNVTGTSDLAPIDKQIELLLELVPDAECVGILYCSAEANSVYQADIAEETLKEKNVEVERYTVADSNDIQQVVTNMTEHCDVIYLPTDNVIANNMEGIKNITVPAKIPVICGEENMCSVGGLATLSISYYNLGYNAGLMAYEILINGKNPGDMPIEYADEVTVKYNADVAEALGMEMPEDMTAIEKGE